MANRPTGIEDEENSGLLARERQGDNAAPLSVSEISQLLKRTVEDRFGHVRLRGELSGVKRAASGHFYCALKDENAVIDGVMWRGNAARLAFRPEDGIEVIATGKLTTYPGRSKYQIVIESMEIAGEGALLALLAKLKDKLEAEGLFAASAKRRLPFLPRTIGVVTSPTGAVIRDILHRLNDRFPSHVIVWPVMVQGQGSAEQIASAVDGFSKLAPDGLVPRPDLVIVARGGGSIEDLWSFNEEIVVRAIANCTIPVISAVGHETDTTLSDFAADLRAPTPTAAAEIAVPVRQELRALLDEYAARKRRGVIRPVMLARERLTAWSERLPDPAALVAAQGQRLDDLTDRLRRGLAGRADRARAQLAQSGGGLRPALLLRNLQTHRRDLARVPDARNLIRVRHRDAMQALAALARVLPQLNPEAPLARGYAIITDAEGRAITNRAAAATQPALTLKFRDGSLDVTTGAPPRPARKPSRPAGESGQQSLF
ncbi:exodeoxyribonuclease VII large subunit [Croceicoccus ponticola]|uniref:Exodeoxyribonuclease 7 large subunit n=1 Tax=Croceicoccus ponticola TaxID=2217664 RepID=A0A437GYA6_9SPHN|nr:exodeoxyribonuclease VII large subunit [Croceicoccus ponticola]RVQ67651.1 exodeoxyribonuclease VII large subunit [Croceicoccus ponticola]